MKLTAPIISGVAVLALTNVALAEDANLASADEPIMLTDMQMDSVTAGAASVFAFASGNVTVNGDFFLDNLPGVFAVASISASITPFASDAFVFLSAAATLP